MTTAAHVQLAPDRRFHDAIAQLVQPERMSWLTQEQAEVLAIVISDGMAARRRIEEVRGAAMQFDAPTPPGDLLALVRGRPLLFQPGSSYSYSNSNYVLLGLIIERLSGIQYSAFLQRQIFGPLGMGSSGYERDFGRVPKHATGYGYKTTMTTESIPTDEAAFSDGGLYSTVDDLLRFDQALYGDRLLPSPLRDEMFTPWGGPGIDAVAGVETGLGWNLKKDASGQPVVFHGGQIPGYNAMLERHLGPHVTVAVLSNFYWARSDEIASLLAGQAP